MFYQKLLEENLKNFSFVYKIFLKIYIICSNPFKLLAVHFPRYDDITKYENGYSLSLTLYTVLNASNHGAYTFVSISIFRDRNCTIRFNNSFSGKFFIIAQYRKRILWQIELMLSMLIVSAYSSLTIYFINV